MTVKQTVGMVEVPRNQLGQMAAGRDLGSPCMPLTDLSQTAPFVGVFDYNLGDVAYYTPASATSAFLNPQILASVTASIDTVPQYFGSLVGVLEAVDDQRAVLVSSTPTTSTAFAPRATSVTLSVDGSPAGYACAADSTVVPLSGSAQIKTTCLEYGLLFAIVSAT